MSAAPTKRSEIHFTKHAVARPLAVEPAFANVHQQ
jgi:hypothetical protein